MADDVVPDRPPWDEDGMSWQERAMADADTLGFTVQVDTDNEIERLQERVAYLEAANTSLSRLLAEVEYERDEALGRHE